MYIFLDSNVYSFGLPRYFYRGTLTSGIVKIPMVYLQWVPFILDKKVRTTFNGRIRLDHWNQWPVINLNPNISTTTLKPSRFAMAFIPPTNGAVYVDVAFIALDAECLGELNQDNFTTDFGDNKFPYFQGNTSIRLKEQKDDEEEDEEQDLPTANDFELLKGYIPTPVLRYLLDQNPLGL
jgi:hypothetical protein